MQPPNTSSSAPEPAVVSWLHVSLNRDELSFYSKRAAIPKPPNCSSPSRPAEACPTTTMCPYSTATLQKTALLNGTSTFVTTAATSSSVRTPNISKQWMVSV